MYFMWGRKRRNSKENKRIYEIESEIFDHMVQNTEVAEDIQKQHLIRFRLAVISGKKASQSIIIHKLHIMRLVKISFRQ